MIPRENGTLRVAGLPYHIECEPALEHQPRIPAALRRQIGDRFVMLLGLRGSGKTTIARKLDAAGVAVRVPIRVTRPLRADEETYLRKTGIRELISVSEEEFRNRGDYLAVGHYWETYYGLSLQDLLESYEKAKNQGPEVKILLASGNSRHTILVRETFPLVRAILLSVNTEIRQARVDRDLHRPPSQRVAAEEDEWQTMAFYRALADLEVNNEATLEETLRVVTQYLDEVTALRDDVLLPRDRAYNLQRFTNALSRHRIPYAVFAGFAVQLYTKNRKVTDIDILVPDLERAARAARFELHREGDDQWAMPFPEAEVWGPVRVRRGGVTYVFPLTDEMIAARHTVELPLGVLPLICPEDIVLLKALLQRGRDVGKYDREDIVALDKHYQLDRQYIGRRANKLGCERLALPYLEEILA